MPPFPATELDAEGEPQAILATDFPFDELDAGEATENELEARKEGASAMLRLLATVCTSDLSRCPQGKRASAVGTRFLAVLQKFQTAGMGGQTGADVAREAGISRNALSQAGMRAQEHLPADVRDKLT
jgi:hypothetical protein